MRNCKQALDGRSYLICSHMPPKRGLLVFDIFMALIYLCRYLLYLIQLLSRSTIWLLILMIHEVYRVI